MLIDNNCILDVALNRDVDPDFALADLIMQADFARAFEAGLTCLRRSRLHWSNFLRLRSEQRFDLWLTSQLERGRLGVGVEDGLLVLSSAR